MENTLNIIVIGAGPAGLTAAVVAAAHGATVTVLEKMSAPGLKLLASGGGKCNLTNVLPAVDFAARFGRQGRFTLPALNAFSNDALRNFFAERGVPTVIEEDGFHVFPATHSARDVLNALLKDCEKHGVKICCSTSVKELIIEDSAVKGVKTTDNNSIMADIVISAAGGRGYTALGGGDAGYRLAEQAGHEIIRPLPGLTGLHTVEDWPCGCTGNSFKRASVKTALPGRHYSYTEPGELLFTHKGISGPSVIDLAGEVSFLLQKHTEVPVSVNFFADRTKASWLSEFQERQSGSGTKHIHKILTEYMPRSVAEVFCGLAGISSAVKAAEFNAVCREKLAVLLSSCILHVKAVDGWEKAMVTRGGVSLKKVNPDSLESRLVKGLYFAGEQLDLDGPCGGFNLQWAFSSGCLAALSSVKKIKN